MLHCLENKHTCRTGADSQKHSLGSVHAWFTFYTQPLDQGAVSQPGKGHITSQSSQPTVTKGTPKRIVTSVSRHIQYVLELWVMTVSSCQSAG